MAFVGVVSNGPHLASTWTRVDLDRRELAGRPFALVGVPVLIATALALIVGYSGTIVPLMPAGNLASDLAPIAGDPGRVFNSVVLSWATWHFAAPCFGLVRTYQRKSGEAWRPAHRAEAAFVFAAAASGLLWRLHFGPRELFGREALAPPIPLAVVVPSVAASLVEVAADQVRQARGGQRVAWSRLGFLAVVLVGFRVPFLGIKSGTVLRRRLLARGAVPRDRLLL